MDIVGHSRASVDAERIVQLLLDNHINVNLKGFKGSTVLIHAAMRGHTDIVQDLLDKNVDTELKDDEVGLTALMWAALYGHLKTVQVLLEKGSNVNARGNSGETALIYAAVKGHTSIIQALLNAGADVNAKAKKKDAARFNEQGKRWIS